MSQVLILTSGISGTPPPPPPPSSFNPMGGNLNAGGSGTMYYEGFPLFRNRVREAYGFVVPGSSYPGTPVTCNASGWPTESFGVILWSSGNGSTSQASWIEGTFSCGFTGSGAETVTGVLGASVSDLVQSGGVTTFKLSNVIANAGFTVGNVTQAVTDVFAYLPAYNSLTSIDNPLSPSAFTADAVAHYGQYGFIRAMQWTNVIRNSTTMTNANRATASNIQCAYWGLLGGLGTSEGVPLDWIASLCMACKCGMWLNVGPLFDNSFSYITALAEELYAMVPAGVPIYLEIGNELWNDAGPGQGAWESAASGYGGQPQYYAYQAHNIATIFRSVFGSRYGTDVRLVLAWQAGGNGVYFEYEVYGQYATNGWSVQADFWCTSLAPYVNLYYSSGQYGNSVAQIEATLTAYGANQMMTQSAECCTVMGLKYGLPQLCYEGGWQVNSEPAGITNINGACMDSGMKAVMETFYQGVANSGALGIAIFSDGVYSNVAYDPTGSTYCPVDELDYSYSDLIAGNSPRWQAIQTFTGGWTPARNVVSGSGSVVQGSNYVDTTGGSNGTLSGTNYPSGCGGAPNYGGTGYCTYLINCTQPGTYSLVVNVTNSGASGLTGLEYGGMKNPATVLPSTVAIPSGSGNVTVGNVTLVAGANYVALGQPGTAQSGITIHTLTFN